MTLPLEIDEPAEAPVRYLPESAMVAMLRQRHDEVHAGARRWAYADHVPTLPMNTSKIRIVDFMAVDCWKGRDEWAVHGFEIKASRADWLAELRNPEKAETAIRYCDRWWLVVSDLRIVLPGELPPKWGLLAVEQHYGLDRLVQYHAARRIIPEPWPKSLVASFARAVAKSARAASQILDHSVGETA